jgi:ribosome-associated translation inhibitor RaiA
MQVQFNTDESIEGTQELAEHAESLVRRVLDRFKDHVTRIEVHVSDVNGPKTTENDKRCLMEARIAGRQPIAVTEMANTVHQALDGAAHKLRRALDTTLGKLNDRKRTTPPSLDEEAGAE